MITLIENLFTDHIFAYSLLQQAKKDATQQVTEIETGKKFILISWLKNTYIYNYLQKIFIHRMRDSYLQQD